MPKPKTSIDELLLIELVKNNPELYERNIYDMPEATIQTEVVWSEIAEKLDAPVEVVKKTWKNLRQRYHRRSSLRKLPDDNLSFLDKLSDVYSNENSCASSNCSSPKGDSKRSVRSISQLSTASEAERSFSTLMSSTKANLRKLDDSKRSKKQESPEDHTTKDDKPTEIKLNKKPTQIPPERRARSRMSEPSHLVSKEVLQNDITLANELNNTPKRLSGTPNAKNKMKKMMIAASDPTRVFFESMAMTVSTFPQHIQATIKLQICNIVAETEYGLSKGC